MSIAPALPWAKSLQDLTRHPGQWFVLATKAREDAAHRRDENPPDWQYAEGVLDIESMREAILKASESNRIFCPQRILPDHIEWLGYAFVSPPSKIRKILPRPSNRIFGLG